MKKIILFILSSLLAFGQPTPPTTGSLTVNKTTGVITAPVSAATFRSANGIGTGAGTVTSVSVTTANGVSGSVATATTTPAITVTLGAITPTSVNSVVLSGASTPTLAVTGTTTVSGANTGDQTTVSGNAGSATTVATTATSTAASYFPLFVASSSNGNQATALSTGLTFNPSTGLFTATGFSGTTGTLGGITHVSNAIGAANSVTSAAGSNLTFAALDTNKGFIFNPHGTGGFTLNTNDNGYKINNIGGTGTISGILTQNAGTNEWQLYSDVDDTDALKFDKLPGGRVNYFKLSQAGFLSGPLRITGGASNFMLIAGTGASRILTFQTTTSGSVATTGMTIDATQVVNIPTAVSASSATTGSLTIGNGTAATNVGIGGGNINAGGTLTVGGTSTLTGAVTQTAKTATYNNVATAGWGVPAIYKAGRVTAQSAANASISTYTVGAADGSFEVSGNMNVTASTTLVTTLTCTYTDESNTARSMIFPILQLAGSFVAAGAITGTGAWETPVIHIRCKAATAITILTSAGTFTGVTYTAEGIIKQTN